jgi:hypothetical protein
LIAPARAIHEVAAEGGCPTFHRRDSDRNKLEQYLRLNCGRIRSASAILLAMPAESKSERGGLFPELSQFADRAEGEAALSAARNRIFRQTRRWIILVVVLLGVGVAIALLALGLKNVLRTNVSWIGAFAGPVAGFVWVWVANVMFRRPIQRDLREQLAKRGVPICIPCGYDLRGSVSGRCPECGAPSSGAAA